MDILFYTPLYKDDTYQDQLNGCKTGEYPAHLLYGITALEKMGHKIHFPDGKFILGKKAGRFELYKDLAKNAINILRNSRNIDILYTPYKRGLEFLIFLRTIGFYRKKIYCWEHATIIPKRGIRKYFQKFHFIGIDHLLFFGQKNLDDSVKGGVITRQKAHHVIWGPDVDKYDSIKKNIRKEDNLPLTFISTGRDSRDYETMVQAFEQTNARFILYVTDPYLLKKYSNRVDNIEVRYMPSSRDSSREAMIQTIKADISVICCKPTKPTANGYTAICEAIGIGMPFIYTKNAWLDFNIDIEKIGITVEIGNVESLKSAINFFLAKKSNVSEYCLNARSFALGQANINVLAKQLDVLFKSEL